MAFEKERQENKGKRYEILFPLHEIDSFNGEELKGYINSAAQDVDAMVIDFSKVAYLNSSGLRELIQILKLLKEQGKTLLFSSLSPDMKRVFVHTNLEKFFMFYDNVNDAVKALSDNVG